MKKKTYAAVIAAVVLGASITACGSKASTAASTAATTAATEAATEAAAEASTEAAAAATTELTGPQDAEYTVYNSTGEKVTELYLYENGSSDKGENYAKDGLADGASVVIDRTEDASVIKTISYTLEYTTESGRNASFTTLHFETVPINLLAEDAMTGATPLQFAIPEK